MRRCIVIIIMFQTLVENAIGGKLPLYENKNKTNITKSVSSTKIRVDDEYRHEVYSCITPTQNHIRRLTTTYKCTSLYLQRRSKNNRKSHIDVRAISKENK